MCVQCTFEFSIDTFLHLSNQMSCRNVIRFWNFKSILYTEIFFRTYEGCPESFETVPISYKVFISRKQNLYHIKEQLFIYMYAE